MPQYNPPKPKPTATPMTAEQLQAMYETPSQANINAALNKGIVKAGNASGNNASNQVQQGSQTGAFESTGTETQQQQQTQTQQQTGQQTTGTSQQQTGQTGVVDTLGLGGLLQGQAGQAANTTAATNNFLTGVIQDGNPNLQSQVQQAVNNATSGPGMVGAGQSANARAAGYAGAEVGRQAMGQQLQAAQQLSGPTAITTLANAGNPYLGQTQANTSTGVQQQDTTTNALGTTLSNLVSNQQQQGTADSNSTQVAVGQSPVQEQKGGKIICTVLVHHGLFKRVDVARELTYFRLYHKRYLQAIVGYLSVAQPLAMFALKHKWFAYLCYPFAKLCQDAILARHEHRRPKFLARCAYTCFFFLSDKLGGLLLRHWPSRAQSKVTKPRLVKLLNDLDLHL